ncbi:MAG TPA: 16S rRNA (cytidine(1402)-2'-O)-methyltransferase [Eubacterium sp.]|nr:16S rRNA (cytidine(1402)-2'-O)-methyltransferase [Eubacterium sp.]
MAGKLYLCATPIGNLEDMTYRGVRTLKEVDLIGAEDTRNSIKLLNHFEIETPMQSYHEFNKYDKAKELVQMMLDGKDIALITDAGTPGISDPGEELVKECLENGIEVTSLPGASACVTAISMSGLSTQRFCFEAFLPKDKKKKENVLKQLQNETRTIIIYEAPHRLAKTLAELEKALGNRRVSINRELTKKYEESFLTTLKDAREKYEAEEPRGEFVLVIEGKDQEALDQEERQKWEDMSLENHMKIYLDEGLDKKAAMKKVAKDRGVSKRDIYNQLVQEEK